MVNRHQVKPVSKKTDCTIDETSKMSKDSLENSQNYTKLILHISEARQMALKRYFHWQYQGGMKSEFSKRLWKTWETIWKLLLSCKVYLEIVFDCHVFLAWPQLIGMPAFMQISHSVEKILDHCKRGSLYSRVHTKSEPAAGSSSFNCVSSSSIWNALLVIWALDTAQCSSDAAWCGGVEGKKVAWVVAWGKLASWQQSGQDGWWRLIPHTSHACLNMFA